MTLDGEAMTKAFWISAGIGLAMLTGCGQRMSYSDLDATRANALNALDRANSAYTKVEELASRVDDLESQVSDLESQVSDLEARLE